MKKSRAVICGIVRDCAVPLKRNIPVINRLRKCFRQAHIVIVENDSQDGTKDLLSQWAKTTPDVHIKTGTDPVFQYSENRVRPCFSCHRIGRMASYRNQYLDFIENQPWEYDYVIIVDLDIERIFIDGIAHSFGQDTPWDAVTSNGKWLVDEQEQQAVFYDTYAFLEENSRGPQTAEAIYANQKALAHLEPGMPMVRVDSGFNGLAVYKAASIRGLRYRCESNNDPQVETCCEHVTFHRDMAANGHGLIFVNPSQVVYYNFYFLKPKGVRQTIAYCFLKAAQLIRERRMPDKLKYFLYQYHYLFPGHLFYNLRVEAALYLMRRGFLKLPGGDKETDIKTHLLISFYKEADPDRLRELKRCVQYNIVNPYITDIHVFYEKMGQGSVEEFLRHPRIVLHDYDMDKNGDVTYRYLIDFANANFNGDIVIIANTDIYFDHTLKHFADADFDNTVLALTRYNEGRCGYLNSRIWERNAFSQDCWIFKAPLRGCYADICLGWGGCDNRIAYEMDKAGLVVLNPSEDIKTWHVHKSPARKRLPTRTYQNEDHFKERIKTVPFARLKRGKGVVKNGR